jgi:hypothetical protein
MKCAPAGSVDCSEGLSTVPFIVQDAIVDKIASWGARFSMGATPYSEADQNSIADNVIKPVAKLGINAALAAHGGVGLVRAGVGLYRSINAARAGIAEVVRASARGVLPPGGKGCPNCVNIAAATDATLAGNPATALPSGPTANVFSLEQLYGQSFRVTLGEAEITSLMQKWGPGSRGIVFAQRFDEAGHVFNVVNSRRVVTYVNGGSLVAPAWEGQGYIQFYLLPTFIL